MRDYVSQPTIQLPSPEESSESTGVVYYSQEVRGELVSGNRYPSSAKMPLCTTGSYRFGYCHSPSKRLPLLAGRQTSPAFLLETTFPTEGRILQRREQTNNNTITT